MSLDKLLEDLEQARQTANNNKDEDLHYRILCDLHILDLIKAARVMREALEEIEEVITSICASREAIMHGKMASEALAEADKIAAGEKV